MHPRQELPDSATALIRHQSGLITRSQALGCGLTSSAVTRLARQWQPLARGVYLTTPAADGSLSWEVRAWAGILRFGPDARLWRRDAAVVHGLLDRPAPVPAPWAHARPIELLVRADKGVVGGEYRLTRERPGPRESSTTTDPAATRVDDTVLDLIAGGTADDVITWLTRAVQRRRTTPERLLRRLAARPRVRHRTLILAVLDDVAAGSTTHLELSLIATVLRPHALPIGRRQLRNRATGAVSDLGYPEYRLIIEVDGRVGHVGEGAFRDRRRDNAHAVRGWTTLRFGWSDVTGDPCAVAADVARVLSLRGWTGQHRPCPRCRAELIA